MLLVWGTSSHKKSTHFGDQGRPMKSMPLKVLPAPGTPSQRGTFVRSALCWRVGFLGPLLPPPSFPPSPRIRPHMRSPPAPSPLFSEKPPPPPTPMQPPNNHRTARPQVFLQSKKHSRHTPSPNLLCYASIYTL